MAHPVSVPGSSAEPAPACLKSEQPNRLGRHQAAWSRSVSPARSSRSRRLSSREPVASEGRAGAGARRGGWVASWVNTPHVERSLSPEGGLSWLLAGIRAGCCDARPVGWEAEARPKPACAPQAQFLPSS